MASQPQQYAISDGPGKFDLMIGLFGDEGNRRVRLSFQVPHESPPGHKPIPDGITYWVELSIWSLTRANRSDEDWIMSGRVARSNYDILMPSMGMMSGDAYRFEASFSTRTRKGTITFTELTAAEQCG